MQQRVAERVTCAASEATNRISALTHHAPAVANGVAAHTHDAQEAINGVTQPTVCASEDLNGTMAARSTAQAMTEVVAPARITLNGVAESVKLWHYIDPMGQEQGPHSMDEMRKWQKAGYFDLAFPVWRTGQTKEEAILLGNAMRMAF
jgi:hypothetical protein